MSCIRYFLYFIFLHLIRALPQINLDLADWISNNEADITLQHDCLHVAASMESVKDPHQIISYCMSEWPSQWNIEKNSIDQIFTFNELFKLNITSEQLYLWSAPIDIVENYQLYLNQLSTSNKRSTATQIFYNCTQSRFGPMCQYSLDDYKPHHSSLNEIIHDFYFNNQYELAPLTCYTHLQCNLGSSLLCLDWSDICDERIHCLDGTDEEYCWQLEINPCKENEYRCRNGQCIPFTFFNDNPNAPDCLDRSDEKKLHEQVYYNSMTEPTFRYEDVTCTERRTDEDDYQSPFTISCIENRHNFIVQSMFSERTNSIPDLCWSALMCYFNFLDLSTLKCDEICQSEKCKEIIEKNCPDMFYMPTVPVLFGHIYLAYTKEYIMSSSTWENAPEYVCYNEQLCDGFDSNKTLILFNNTTCRRPEDFPLYFGWGFGKSEWYLIYVKSLYIPLFKCNTIIRNNLAFCDRSTMYQCVNSSKCISKIRLLDGMLDCNYGDDELPILFDTICSTENSNTHFECTESNACISRKLLEDDTCNCPSEFFDLCDDEYTDLTYIKKHISFPTICDGFTELKSVMIDEQQETDETECDQWLCNNTYTRCDGIWNCYNGADEVDCYLSSLVECPPLNHICVSRNTSDFMCLSLDKVNNSEIDCLGATDEPDLCPTTDYSLYEDEFYCETIYVSSCIAFYMLCDEVNVCVQGDDEQFCSNFSRSFSGSSFCSREYESVRSNVEEFFCNRLNVTRKSKIVHFSLEKVTNFSQNSVRKQETSMISTRSAPVHFFSQRQQHCHRGLNLRVWLNSATNLTDIKCLCPPSLYGNKCQYQNQRISFTIKLQSWSHSWRTLFTLVVSLIDDSNEQIIHSHEQLTYLSMQNCQRKFNIYLLYSTRPKNQSKQYSIHIDIYEKISLSYRGSFLLPVSFPFLPVQRIAVQLNIPHTADSTRSCSDHRCVHGKCIKYVDDSNNARHFCRCDRGWSGRQCNLPRTCMCSSDSLCIGVLANNRSLCVCPINKWGSRCLLHDQVCHSNQNAICRNGGQCIPIDQYVVSNKKFECICPKGFMGDTCEIPDNKIILSFDKRVILPESMFVHFIEVKDNASPENGITFKRTPINQNSVTVYWSHPFHIAFVELIVHNYYLIAFRKTYNRSTTITKTLEPSDRCMSISEVFNETFARLHLLRRIKYYHLPCQKRLPPLSCFHDDVHMCLCDDFGQQRVANCFEFNHNMKLNCSGKSNCENGAQCLQDSITCPKTSMCVCPKCFYGARCQFSSNGFGLSLDAILGYHILPHVNIAKQPSIVLISVVLTIVITVAGLINGVLSLMTFNNKEPLTVGCGFFLLGSSITTLLTMIMFALKFWILIGTQISYSTNRSFLHYQCISIDFFLRIGLNMDQWLNACVAIDRATVAKKGLNFDQKKSRQMAKYIILLLLLLTIGTAIQDPFHRRLIDDDNGDDEKRIWCTITYSPSIQIFDSVVSIFHFFAPSAINLISAILIIKTTVRQQTTIRHQQYNRKLVYTQLQQHKHILLAPLILVILAVPRLITSFVSGCMKSSRDSWLFLAGYFISFIPPMLTFVIFVLPSKFYTKEFRKSVLRYWQMVRTRLHLMP